MAVGLVDGAVFLQQRGHADAGCVLTQGCPRSRLCCGRRAFGENSASRLDVFCRCGGSRGSHDPFHTFAVGTGWFSIVDRFPNGTRHDWTPPVITLASENLTYVFGDPDDHAVYCDVEDDHSGRYRVFIDGELVRYGYWWPYPDLYGNPFAVLPKDLSVGLHNVTFLIEDLGAYFASTAIWVTILPATATNTTTSTTTTTTTTNTTTNTTVTGSGWIQTFALGVGISSAAVIVVAIYLIARERTMN